MYQLHIRARLASSCAEVGVSMKMRSLSVALAVAGLVTSQMSSSPAFAYGASMDHSLQGSSLIANGLLSDHGKPLASADVVAVAWPSQRILAGLSHGEAVPTYVIGRTKTDSAGRFSLPAAAASMPAKFRGQAGQVDVELVFGDATRAAHWHYSVVPAGPDSITWALQGGTSGRPDLRADLAERIGYETSDTPATWVGSDGTALGSTRGRVLASLPVSAPDRAFGQMRNLPLTTLRTARANAGGREGTLTASPSEICQAYAGTIHYGLNEYFMQAYAWSGALASVYQKNDTSHTLGVGYSTTGSEGGFRANGSQSTTLAASASRGGVADAYVYNRVNYRDYGDSCGTAVTRKPYSVYALLTNFTYTPHSTLSSCQTYTGGTYTKYQGRNYTYGAGMDIGPINVSAQSGWNSTTEIAWSVTKKTKLCGSSSSGWVSSSLASASAG